MEASKSLGSLVLAGVLMGLMSTSGAYDFYVGGKAGWVQNPPEGYSSWAARNRFQINDTLVFKYKKGEDSVLVVKKEDYDSCNVSNPIQRLDGGDSVFNLDRSGTFFFISGAPGHCEKGQKLIVVVLAVRNKKPSPAPTSPPPSPSPFPKPPTSSPFPSPSSSPSPSPKPPTSSPAPSPSISLSPFPSPSISPSSPSPSPSPSSFVSSPSPSPSPSSHVSSPSPSPSPSGQAKSPSPSPSPSSGLSPSPSPAAATGTPTQSPSSQSPPPGTPGSSVTGTPPGPSPSSPPSPKSPASVLTASGVSFGLVALVLGSAFLG